MHLIDRDEVAQRLTYERCIPIVRDAMIAFSRGQTKQLLRSIIPLEDGRMFGVLAPADGREASVGNGTMIGFLLGSRAAVRQIHAKALELGGRCEGVPGPRGPEETQAYFAYFRDLDGNKLCAYSFGPE